MKQKLLYIGIAVSILCNIVFMVVFISDKISFGGNEANDNQPIQLDPMADPVQRKALAEKAVKKLVKKQLDKLKTSPFLGEELGNKNGYDLTGYRKMYACKKQIRIVYSVINDLLLVHIIAIGKREDMEVYSTASERLNV